MMSLVWIQKIYQHPVLRRQLLPNNKGDLEKAFEFLACDMNENNLPIILECALMIHEKYSIPDRESVCFHIFEKLFAHARQRGLQNAMVSDIHFRFFIQDSKIVQKLLKHTAHRRIEALQQHPMLDAWIVRCVPPPQ